MTRIDTRILTLVLACLATATATHARQPEGQGEPQPVVRTYDVSDLMRAAADYPLDSEIVPPTGYGAGGATGAGVFADAPVAKAAAKPDELDALMTLISEFVDSDSWKDNGGSVGSMRGFGTLLVVSQTEANHAKVEQLLDEVRRNAGPARVVAVRATWVAVPNAEAPAAGTVVGDDLIAKHGVYCAGQTVCFSGQTVHVTSGRGHTVVHDLTPIVGDNAVAFDPTVQRVQAGVSLQIAPQLVPGADVAIVDVQSFVSEWAAPGPAAPARGAAATQPSGTAVQVSADVDRINVLAQEMKTTLRVPLGKKFVVGGMTLEPAGEARGDRQLCLVVEITAGK